jgi:hypothetical protein
MSDVHIYFTDFFGVAPEVLEDYGAFNVSLINDLPLFIDPFLLFDSENPTYQLLHREIINYVKFLRDRACEDEVPQASLDHWFLFPEVKQNWLGFSTEGNGGSGCGPDFAKSLQRNLRAVFRNFGTETITRGSHLEKLCLINEGVGRDHLSDFTTNLIQRFLLEYTQAFALEYVDSAKRQKFALDKVSFDYANRRWMRGTFELPAHDGDFVILTPKDILTKDEAWISRGEYVNRFQDIYDAVPDAQLRQQVSHYFYQQLSSKPDSKEFRAATIRSIEEFPQLLDHYVKQKEDDGPAAHKASDAKVRETEEQFVEHIRAFVRDFLVGTPFYELGSSFDEALKRVHFLRDVIENKDGYRLFYMKGQPIKREADLQIMYRLTWFAARHDVNREVNNGRGPVDFKVSKGGADSTLVEFKLASNSKLVQNLKHQVAVYQAANDTATAIKAILYFSDEEHKRVVAILDELKLSGRRDVVLIDARRDNKPSASTVA